MHPAGSAAPTPMMHGDAVRCRRWIKRSSRRVSASDIYPLFSSRIIHSDIFVRRTRLDSISCLSIFVFGAVGVGRNYVYLCGARLHMGMTPKSSPHTFGSGRARPHHRPRISPLQYLRRALDTVDVCTGSGRREDNLLLVIGMRASHD